MSTDLSSHPPRRRNVTKATTRTTLLDTAREMLIERGFDTALTLRLTEVTERAGMTTGAAYQVWNDGQTGFHRDLACYLIEHDVARGSGAVAEAATPGFIAGAPLGDVIADGADAYLRQQLDDLGFGIVARYWQAAQTDDELRRLLRDGYARYHESFRPIYQALLDQYQLLPAPGFTVDDITVAISALADGFTMRAGIDLERVRHVEALDELGELREWSLFAACLSGLVTSMTVRSSKAKRSRRPSVARVQT